jgi:hypothetical protein
MTVMNIRQIIEDKNQKKLKEIHNIKKNINFFESGRGALNAILAEIKNANLRIKKVGVIPFTCSVVPAACIANKLDIIWLDIELNTYSVDYNYLRKIKNLDVIIFQSTYGIVPYYYNEIINYCKKNKIIIIEDIAHSLGTSIDNEYLGNRSDYSFGSFQRSKQISIWSGGFSAGLQLTKECNMHYGKIDIEIIYALIEAFKNRISLLKNLIRLINYFFKKRGMTEKELNGGIEEFRNKKMSLLKHLILYIALKISRKKINNISIKTKNLIKKNYNIFKFFIEYEKNNNLCNSYLRIPVKKKLLNSHLKKYIVHPYWFCLHEKFFSKYKFNNLKNFSKAIEDSKNNVNISLYN